MSNFAAPNMTAVGTIGGPGMVGWQLGGVQNLGGLVLPMSFAQGARFTIEAWVLAGPNAANAQILVKELEFALEIVSGLISAGWEDGSPQLTGSTVLQPGWHYIAVTFDGTALTIYLDGAPDGTLTYNWPGVPSTGSAFYTGGAQWTDDFAVSSITLYDYARTDEQEFNALWVDLQPTPGLIANFDFSIAPPVETVAGYPISPATHPGPGGASKTLAPAIGFDGQSGGMIIGGENPPVIPTQFSVSAWVAWNGGDPNQTIFSSGDLDYVPGPFLLGFASDNGGRFNIFAELKITQNGGLSQIVEAPVTINIGEWHNIALTCDGSAVTLYMDGQAVGDAALSHPLGPNPWPLWTAGFTSSRLAGKERWFNGYIQWLSVWGRCLSPDEVVYQQYGSVSSDPAILADLSLDDSPPTDVANLVSIELGGTAGPVVQEVTVTAWNPPPEQLNPPSAAAVAGRAIRRLSVNWPTPVVGLSTQPIHLSIEAQLTASVALLDPHLAGVSTGAAALLRDRFERSTRQALEAAQANPNSLQQATWHREGDDEVFVFNHPQDGRVELLRVRADGITACQKWWGTFLVSLLAGILSLVFVKFSGKTLFEWIESKILNNRTVMGQLAAAWAADPSFTGFTVVHLLAVIYSAGLLRSFFWFVASQAGWYQLLRLFAYFATVILGAGSTLIAFAANAAVLAVQLGLQVVGVPESKFGPDIPGYSSSCGS